MVKATWHLSCLLGPGLLLGLSNQIPSSSLAPLPILWTRMVKTPKVVCWHKFKKD